MRRTAFWLVVLLAMTLAVPGMAEFVFTSAEEETQPATEQPAAPAEPVWSYPISREILADPLDVLVLTNKENLLDSDYPPQDDELHKLIETTVKKTKNVEMKVRTITNDALTAMFAAADADGATLRIHSAYRSYRTQSTMYSNRLESKGYDDGVVQKPGASEHQTGLVADVINPAWAKKDRLNSEFAKTTEGQWLANNCMRFGFIIRYPEGRDDITGIIYEPWHIRYVGIEVATYMMANNLTLEEFTAEYRQALADFGQPTVGDPVVSDFSF